MKTSQFAIVAVLLLGIGGATALTSEAASTYNGSIIVGIDRSQRTVTFQTKEGQTWTLPVSDPSIFEKNQVAKGDQVSIEVDLGDRITTITKLSQSSQTQPRDDVRP